VWVSREIVSEKKKGRLRILKYLLYCRLFVYFYYFSLGFYSTTTCRGRPCPSVHSKRVQQLDIHRILRRIRTAFFCRFRRRAIIHYILFTCITLKFPCTDCNLIILNLHSAVSFCGEIRIISH